MAEFQPKKRLTREEAKQQTREQLLLAAAQVFAQKGFHGASIDEIAETAGYTKGAVYTHFSTKDDLYLALLDQSLDRESSIWTQIIEEGLEIKTHSKELEKELLTEYKNLQTWNLLTLEFMVYALRNPEVKQRIEERIYKGIGDYETSLTKRFSKRTGKTQMSLPDLAKTLLVFDNGFGLLSMISEPEQFVSLYTKILSDYLD
jgi:AcrR family transcriptional regulator